MPDMLPLSSAIVLRSPADIADWPITRSITRVTMDPEGGVSLEFDAPLPESWKWPSNPDQPSDNYQFTVWAVVRYQGQWYASGYVQMWQGRAMGNRSLPPILTDYVNWWGDVRRLWEPIADYRPQAGDLIGFLVSAGNARLVTGVTSVRERSNVVQFALPEQDNGVFSFPASSPIDPPIPPAPTPPAIVDELAKIAAALVAMGVELAALRRDQAALKATLSAIDFAVSKPHPPLHGPFGWTFRP